jgi:hypothetical protein
MFGLFRGSTIALAVLLSSRSLWLAFVEHQMSTDGALIRVLIAIPVAGLLLGGLRVVTGSYQPHARPTPPAPAASPDVVTDP